MLTNSFKPNYGSFFVRLKPWDGAQVRGAARQRHHGEVCGRSCGDPRGGRLPLRPPDDLRLRRRRRLQLPAAGPQRHAVDRAELGVQTRNFLAAARQRPELGTLFTSFDPSVPADRASSSTARRRASWACRSTTSSPRCRPSSAAPTSTTSTASAACTASTSGRAEYRQKPEDIGTFYVRSKTTGDMVPLSTLVTITRRRGTEITDRFNLLRSVEIRASPRRATPRARR